jgi:hypothetical protein
MPDGVPSAEGVRQVLNKRCKAFSAPLDFDPVANPMMGVLVLGPQYEARYRASVKRSAACEMMGKVRAVAAAKCEVDLRVPDDAYAEVRLPRLES